MYLGDVYSSLLVYYTSRMVFLTIHSVCHVITTCFVVILTFLVKFYFISKYLFYNLMSFQFQTFKKKEMFGHFLFHLFVGC